MTDPHEVAAKLTKAQREFMMLLPKDGSYRTTSVADIRRHGANSLRGFGQSKLIDGYYEKHGMGHRLTELGLAVRAILQEQSHD